MTGSTLSWFGATMWDWFRNVSSAVATAVKALWVCLRYWFRTYDPKRRRSPSSTSIPNCRCRFPRDFAAFTATT